MLKKTVHAIVEDEDKNEDDIQSSFEAYDNEQ